MSLPQEESAQHLKSRRPPLDFAQSSPHWAPDPAFAQVINAGSTSLPQIEPYLNRVMARASELIADPALKRDIAAFRAQETNHYKLHTAFNAILLPRYPGIAKFQNAMDKYYREMLEQRSLLDNAAYCEGFESLGLIHAAFFFGQIHDLLQDADRAVVDLWRWHLAEEFEHRSVCFEVHEALGGTYFTRMSGFFHALKHLGGYGRAVSAYLIETDCVGLSEADRDRWARQKAAYDRRFERFARPFLLRILSPTYDPRKRAALPGIEATLTRFDASGARTQSTA